MKCKYCGYDTEIDGPITSADGAPCGINGCMYLTCCYESWKDHAEKAHYELYHGSVTKAIKDV